MSFEINERVFVPAVEQNGTVLSARPTRQNWQRRITSYTVVTDDGVKRSVAGDWGLMPSIAPLSCHAS